ncbi:hypothetical protein NDU88_009936 [Pleurodeles waltl]|uniref:Uncharacterized protein n=1 Tax=Pleurodeles waltl TaxID=8319 RepID=A0AAV7RWM9_PLEWA|nr:hypothetical protein NDU88_009936 [Pleurodeles waltl]
METGPSLVCRSFCLFFFFGFFYPAWKKVRSYIEPLAFGKSLISAVAITVLAGLRTVKHRRRKIKPQATNLQCDSCADSVNWSKHGLALRGPQETRHPWAVGI